MKSAIYTGWVRHHRFSPVQHRLMYKVSMFFLELGALDQLFRNQPFWSNERSNVVSFWRKDHHGSEQEPLEESIRQLVRDRTGIDVQGKTFLLTNMRYFGFAMNPVSFYYCFDSSEQLKAIVAEVNNTPWGEQHCYVFSIENRNRKTHRFEFQKEFHVSPFMDMDQTYDWRIGEPHDRLVVHMKNLEKQNPMLTATMSLRRHEFTRGNLFKNLIQYPFVTGKVFAGIYWNALKLYLKKVPFYPHPDKRKDEQLKPELESQANSPS